MSYTVATENYLALYYLSLLRNQVPDYDEKVQLLYKNLGPLINGFSYDVHKLKQDYVDLLNNLDQYLNTKKQLLDSLKTKINNDLLISINEQMKANKHKNDLNVLESENNIELPELRIKINAEIVRADAEYHRILDLKNTLDGYNIDQDIIDVVDEILRMQQTEPKETPEYVQDITDNMNLMQQKYKYDNISIGNHDQKRTEAIAESNQIEQLVINTINNYTYDPQIYRALASEYKEKALIQKQSMVNIEEEKKRILDGIQDYKDVQIQNDVEFYKILYDIYKSINNEYNDEYYNSLMVVFYSTIWQQLLTLEIIITDDYINNAEYHVNFSNQEHTKEEGKTGIEEINQKMNELNNSINIDNIVSWYNDYTDFLSMLETKINGLGDLIKSETLTVDGKNKIEQMLKQYLGDINLIVDDANLLYAKFQDTLQDYTTKHSNLLNYESTEYQELIDNHVTDFSTYANQLKQSDFDLRQDALNISEENRNKLTDLLDNLNILDVEKIINDLFGLRDVFKEIEKLEEPELKFQIETKNDQLDTILSTLTQHYINIINEFESKNITPYDDKKRTDLIEEIEINIVNKYVEIDSMYANISNYIAYISNGYSELSIQFQQIKTIREDNTNPIHTSLLNEEYNRQEEFLAVIDTYIQSLEDIVSNNKIPSPADIELQLNAEKENNPTTIEEKKQSYEQFVNINNEYNIFVTNLSTYISDIDQEYGNKVSDIEDSKRLHSSVLQVISSS